MKKQSDLPIKNILLFVLGIMAVLSYSFVAQIPMIAILLIFIFVAILKISCLNQIGKKYCRCCLVLLFLLGIFSILALRDYTSLSPYILPLSIFPMLVILLYRDLELAIIFSIVLSILAGLFNAEDLYLTIVLLIGSVSSILFVWQARRRSKIIAAGFFVGLIQALAMLTLFSFFGRQTLQLCFLPFLNGLIASFFVASILPVFEYLFNVSTNISLLELADFNHPLLKRLVLEAPGTYHHSLMVGNLAEMASEAVGANALLARVGAYYHDVGKLVKPEYFSENQGKFSSKHDDLSASMSTLVIMDHVKSGEELAKKFHLNNAIIDFITQHHGTSLVYYFYRRALESPEIAEGVKEEVFRYPGPKPQTKETAIVLLADSVEAACRTLEEATAERISDVVRKIMNNKFIDGQLDMCDLTLKDLEKISSVFIHILGAFYHSRIEYPEQNKGENR